jgi:Zn finger protein HypA/HybF involved in hydrogenase expression
MHELSLALEVCRIAEQRVGSAALPAVRSVAVEVGTASGIEVENFRFCLESLLAAPPFVGARPVILSGPGDALRVSYLEVDDGGPDD